MMDKDNLEGMIDRLRQMKVDDKDIPALMMTAYYESGFDTKAVGENKDDETGEVISKDIGFFQMNAASFYDKKGNPDPTLTRFFKRMGENTEMEQSQFEKKLLNEKYNTAFASHVIRDFREHSTIEPFTKWAAYEEYVKPFLEGDPIPGKNLREQVAGIKAYVDAYLYIHGLQTKESIKKFRNPTVKVLDGFTEKMTIAEPGNPSRTQSATPIQSATMSRETIAEPGNPSRTQSATMSRDRIPEEQDD